LCGANIRAFGLLATKKRIDLLRSRSSPKIADSDRSHPGFSHTLAYFGSFEFPGPYGVHCCVITEALGYSLDYLRNIREDGDRRVQTGVVKCVVKQVLRGLEYLHDVCGIVHAARQHPLSSCES